MLRSHATQCKPRQVWWLAGCRWRLLGIAALVTTFFASGVPHGAEPIDIPGTKSCLPALGRSSLSIEIQQRLLLDSIFPIHAPVFTRPPSLHDAPVTADSTPEALRIAARPDGIDGWRPASTNIGTPAGPQQAPPGSPVAPLDAEPQRQAGAAPSAEELPHEPSRPMPSAGAAPPTIVQFRAPRVGQPHAAPSTLPADRTQPIAGQFEAIASAIRAKNEDGRTPAATGPASAAGTAPGSPSVGKGSDVAAGDEPASAPSASGSSTTGPTNSSPAVAPAPPSSTTSGPSESAQVLPNGTGRDPQRQTADDLLEESPPAGAKPLPPLTRQLISLRSRVRSVLNGYYRKTLNSRDHDPWEVMHGMLAYGVKSRVRQGGPRGEMITSVGWLCYNKPCKGQTLMHVTRDGQLRAKYGVGLQGHLGQLLAMLAQCHVSADYPIRVGSQEFTIRDLIESEKKTCYPKSELTFKLLAFQYYLDLNDKWVNEQGLEWDFPRLIREELEQPVRGAACGGTHRLSSLSLTVKARIRRGEPLDGEYARAAEFVQKYHQYAFHLQNRDGSLSTAWFNGRGDDDDINRRIKTTGHILEWLCYSLSDEELRDQRTIRAVSYLANLMYSNYNNEWEVGPVSHATHALLLYDERVFQPYDQPGYVAPYRPRPATASGVQREARR